MICFVVVVVGCSVDRCAAVPPMSHARPNSSLTLEGTVVHYNCETGYQPSSDDVQQMNIVCDHQHWTSTQAHCTGKYRLTGKSTLGICWVRTQWPCGIPPHPGSPGQGPCGRKMVVVVIVCSCLNPVTSTGHRSIGIGVSANL